MRWCNSVVSSGVCRWCCGGSRAPGVRLARPDVHGYGPGWVWLGVSLLLELTGYATVWAVGVGCGYVVPSAGLVRSQGLAVSGCGFGLICVWVLARLRGCDGSGPGFGAFGRSVPVVVCVGVLRRPVCLVTSGRGLAWRPMVVVCWVTGLGGGAAGRGVRRVVLCGARAPGVLWVPPVSVRRRLWGGEGVCVCGAGLWVMSHRRMLSCCVSWRVSRRRVRTYGWSWGAGRLPGLGSQGLERIGQHGFPCGLRHPPPRWPEAAVLHGPLAGPVDQALEGGLSPGPLSQLPELRVGPALPPLSLGGAAVLGGGVGVHGCDGVVGTGGGGGPGGFLVVLYRGGARGVRARAGSEGARGCGPAGVRARSPPRGWAGTRGGGGSGACAVCGLSSRVGRGAETLLVDPGVVLGWSGAVRGPGVRALRGGGTRCVVLWPRRAAL